MNVPCHVWKEGKSGFLGHMRTCEAITRVVEEAGYWSCAIFATKLAKEKVAKLVVVELAQRENAERETLRM